MMACERAQTFSSRRSLTATRARTDSMTGLFCRAIAETVTYPDTAHKQTSDPTVTPDTLHLRPLARLPLTRPLYPTTKHEATKMNDNPPWWLEESLGSKRP